jgi:nucleoside-triphosphatase THEP1
MKKAMNTLAAIVYRPGFAIDDFMAGLAMGMKARGLRLGGVVQHNADDCASGCLSMALEDLATGRRFAISAERGSGASGCRLDAAGLAEAGAAIATALSERIDLVIVNKFGRQELLGQGLRQEMAAVVLAGLPLLVAVRDDLLPAWTDFAGEDWTRLQAEAPAVDGWVTGLQGVAA